MTLQNTARAAGARLLHPTELRCEYRVDPLGIDETKPRLSWLLKSDDPAVRGQAQSAYQVLVGGSREALDADKGELWDSGRVKSDETAHVVYAGKPLASQQPCWWKVRVWNGDGAASPWSEPARWSMGLLSPDEWTAQWIGYDAPSDKERLDDSARPNVDLAGVKWIWTDETKSNPTGDAPKGTRHFRKTFTIPADRKVKRATAVVTADNRFQLFVNGSSMRGGNDFKLAYARDLGDRIRPGSNTIAIAATNDAGAAALAARIRIEFADGGAPLIVETDDSWRCTKEELKGKEWREADFNDKDWRPATAVATVGQDPWGMPRPYHLELPPPPYLRKAFDASKPIKRATLYASALGLYELHLNGRRVGDDVLSPGWTDYNKRVHYRAYDVTGHVKQGANALGAILGDGWYAGYYSYQGKRNLYGENPRLIAQLQIEYADGSTDRVVTDNSWKASYGPLLEGDLLMGSAYDARLEMPGWDAPKFDDAQWKPVVLDEQIKPKAHLCAHPGDPVKRVEEIPAKKVTEREPGVFVFDLGQNMVGWVRLRVNGAPVGTRITLRHSEMLNLDGSLYTTALRNARATDNYITAGRESETWEPSFTFHGFRYVEVTGLASRGGQTPSLDTVTGIVAHTAMERSGTFECSNPLVNQLVHNIVWGQKGNYLEVPTDCPQRDERLGWTGDAQFFIPTGAYNFDVAAFFTKWLVDLDTDAQRADGALPSVAPECINGAYGATAWADAGIVCPYVIYKQYGDRRVIERHYDEMRRYIDYLKNTSKDLVRTQGAYGDWVNLGGGASSEVIGTSYFEHVTRLFAEMAAAIGRKDDAKNYGKLADDIRAVFMKNFVTPDGAIKDSSQTGYALAFTMGLIPPETKDAAAQKFVDEIAKKDWHLGTGFIGTPRLLPGLTLAGKSDVAYRLLLTETFPSWLYQVKLGATTMWERWDGWVPEKGYQDPGMNSFNHYAFGSVGEFLYRTVAGIDTDGPGYKRIFIAPLPGGGLTWARASYKSVRGEITSAWRLDGDRLTLDFTIPPNTTATVRVPTSKPDQVQEKGKPIGRAEGVKRLQAEDGAAVFEIVSGSYSFTAPR
jgi:alpha-L-rhamnosidase